MMTTALHPSQKRLVYLLRLWAVLFTVAGASFYLIPNQLFSILNAVTQRIFPSLGMIPSGTDRFWLSLSMSLMITLVLICYLAQKDIEAHFILVKALLAAKFSSTLFFFISFIAFDRLGAYLLGLLVDGLIFLVTFLFYQPVARQLINSHFENISSTR